MTPTPQIVKTPNSRRQSPARSVRWYLVFLALFGSAGAAFVWLSEPPVPPPPEIDLSNAAPLIAQALQEARDEALAEPDSGLARGRLGMLFLAHDLRHQARDCFEQAIRLEPRQFRWRYYLAVLAEDLDLELAARHYKTALMYKADYAPLYHRLGQVQVRLNRIAEARDSYRLAAELAPDSPHPLLSLARLEMDEGNLEETARLIAEAGALAPWLRDVQVEQARLRRRQGDLLSAARIEESETTAPTVPSAMPDPFLVDVEQMELSSNRLAKLADQLLAEGRFEEAANALRRLIEFRPDLPRLRLTLAQVHLRLGDVSTAISIIRDAAARFPQDPTAHFALGTVLESKQRYELAAESYAQAVRLKPDYAEAFYRLGRVWLQLGSPEQALTPFLSALSADPGLLRAQVELAQTYSALGQRDDAIEAARSAVQLAPNDREAMELLERLTR